MRGSAYSGRPADGAVAVPDAVAVPLTEDAAIPEADLSPDARCDERARRHPHEQGPGQGALLRLRITGLPQAAAGRDEDTPRLRHRIVVAQQRAVSEDEPEPVDVRGRDLGLRQVPQLLQQVGARHLQLEAVHELTGGRPHADRERVVALP